MIVAPVETWLEDELDDRDEDTGGSELTLELDRLELTIELTLELDRLELIIELTLEGRDELETLAG